MWVDVQKHVCICLPVFILEESFFFFFYSCSHFKFILEKMSHKHFSGRVSGVIFPAFSCSRSMAKLSSRTGKLCVYISLCREI